VQPVSDTSLVVDLEDFSAALRLNQALKFSFLIKCFASGCLLENTKTSH